MPHCLLEQPPPTSLHAAGASLLSNNSVATKGAIPCAKWLQSRMKAPPVSPCHLIPRFAINDQRESSTLIFISCIMQECISPQWWRGNICPSRLTQLLTLLLVLYTVWQSPCCRGNSLSWRHPVLAYERDPLTYRDLHVHLFAIDYNTLTSEQLALALRVGTSSVS